MSKGEYLSRLSQNRSFVSFIYFGDLIIQFGNLTEILLLQDLLYEKMEILADITKNAIYMESVRSSDLTMDVLLVRSVNSKMSIN